MTANTYKPGQITALYARLSQEDTLEGDSNSIVNQENICQGQFLPGEIALNRPSGKAKEAQYIFHLTM